MKNTYVTLRDATAQALDSAARLMYISPTKYGWATMAQAICQGKASAIDRLRTIYLWICRNIEYDTDYKIYTADECVVQRKGVCQAYCEVFYRLATAVGLKVTLVVGKVRMHDGVSESLHAWAIAYLDPNTPILLDPTWGAGTVNGATFTRSKNHDAWFNVHPEWMIFTHFPNDPVFQLLPNRITLSQFERLPYVAPYMRKFCYTGHEILQCALQHRPLPAPRCYDLDDVIAADIPHSTHLRVGQTYTVRIRTQRPSSDIGVLGSAHDPYSVQWQKRGEVAVGAFKVTRPGTLSLGVRTSPGVNLFNIFATYQVSY